MQHEVEIWARPIKSDRLSCKPITSELEMGSGFTHPQGFYSVFENRHTSMCHILLFTVSVSEKVVGQNSRISFSVLMCMWELTVDK